MAKPGPKPKSSTLKMLEGSRVRSTPTTAVAERMVKLPPAPSRYRDEKVLSLWRSLGHRLIGAGVLGKVDGIFLELLTDAAAAYLNAAETTDHRRIERAGKWLAACLKECGATPASRRGVAILSPATKAKAEPAVRYFS